MYFMRVEPVDYVRVYKCFTPYVEALFECIDDVNMYYVSQWMFTYT